MPRLDSACTGIRVCGHSHEFHADTCILFLKYGHSCVDEFFQSCESSEAMTFRFTSKLPKMGAAKWVKLYAQICGVPTALSIIGTST